MKILPLVCEDSIAGSIKTHPEDFVVEEIPLYEHCGSGEHVYLSVQKKNLSHDDLLKIVARATHVLPNEIGYAGRKDLRAQTTQLLSVHLPNGDVELPSDLGGIRVLWQSRHTNKLHLGHLLGNRFKIRIRNADPGFTTLIQERMKYISREGIPNAFGPQRFGNYKNNHQLGKSILLEDLDQVIHDLALCDRPLSKRVTSYQSISAIAKPLRRLWVNALQSAIFNDGLAQRIMEGTWSRPILGDLICMHGARGRTFEATVEEIKSKEFQSRVKLVEVSPTGPLWGRKMRDPGSTVLERELEVLQSFGLKKSDFVKTKQYGVGGRRPLRVPVKNTSIVEGEDMHGPFVLAQFELPAGSYATVVIALLLNVSI